MVNEERSFSTTGKEPKPLTRESIEKAKQMLVPDIIIRELMVNEETIKERTMGIIPFKKKRRKKESFGGAASYKGFAGLEVVAFFLKYIDWTKTDGVLVCSSEGYYFFGLIAADRLSVPRVERNIAVKYSLGGESETVTENQYPIEVIRLGDEYYNAIQVKSLREAETIPGFKFIGPEEIETQANKYYKSEEYYSSNQLDIASAQPSEYSMGQTEYQEYMALRRAAVDGGIVTPGGPQVSEGTIMIDPESKERMIFTGGRWIVEEKKKRKWKKEEKVDRQLIF